MATFTPSLDGEIGVVSKTTWAEARGATTGTVDKTSAQNLIRGETGFHCARMYMVFDLTSIPAGTSLTGQPAPTLKVTVNSTTSADAAYATIYLVESTQASETDLVATDMDNWGTTSFGTADYTSTGLKTITINASGITFLESKFGGKAMFCLRSKKDYDNVEPAAGFYSYTASVEDGTPANRPTLTITYPGETATSSGYFYFM